MRTFAPNLLPRDEGGLYNDLNYRCLRSFPVRTEDRGQSTDDRAQMTDDNNGL